MAESPLKDWRGFLFMEVTSSLETDTRTSNYGILNP
jgi:hypothetical protein